MKEASQYAVIVDERCPGWCPNNEYTCMYLKMLERDCDAILKQRGYVFLRDIYEMLNVPVTKISLTTGWQYLENNQYGDNYVDFDIRFNEELNNFTVDFNVDGDISSRFK